MSTPSSTPQRLREAADAVRPYTLTIGWAAVAGTPEAAEVAAAHPVSGAALAAVFDKWARMGELDPDLLNRVGGPETVALADLILGTPAAPGGAR
ncbi:hypothetical protein OG900_33515 [Streptomyces sp. NBC_00433]